MNANDLDSRELVRSLYSDVCPACGGSKASGHSVCYRRCWRRLSKDLRGKLYQRIGQGYEAAFLAAMTTLGTTELHLQPAERGGRQA
jgi:hypothetical protein